MPFDEYMAWCLYDEADGFFATGRGPGRERDFVTSPETTPSFGDLIARWAMAADHPSTTPLIEIGAGSGALLASLVDPWSERGGPIYALERSASARSLLAERFPQVEVAAGLDDLPEMDEAVVVANEVLDNMPAALARRRAGTWLELVVDEAGGTLALAEAPARPAVAAWCESAFDGADEGITVAAQVEASRWLREVLARFRRLSMCLIDYGESASVLATRPADEVIRAYRGHRAHRDLLADPGSTDLTVDVNIDGVVADCRESGATVRVSDQRSFLLDLGAREQLDAFERDAAAAARDGRTMDQLIARSRRLDLEAVLDPAGFGGFRVFVIESRS